MANVTTKRKRIGKVISMIIGIVTVAIFIHLFFSMSFIGTDQSRTISKIVFDNAPVPAVYNIKYSSSIKKMKKAFTKLDSEINIENQKLDK